MVTDGADTSDASIDETLASLKARSIPVFTVGVGQERFAHDIQVTRVETPRTRAQGHRARRRRRAVADRLRRPDRAAQRRRRWADREHAGSDAAARRRVGDGARCASPPTKPARDCSGSRCRPQEGEQVTQNNARDALIEVNDRAREGALLRRRAALRMQVRAPRRSRTTRTCRSSSLHRTAENKYYRQRRHQRRRAGRRLPEDARGAVRLPRA